MHCPKCGVSLSPDAFFCNKCGASVSPRDARTPRAHPVAQRRLAQLSTERFTSIFAEGGKAHKALQAGTISCVALAAVGVGVVAYLWIGDLMTPGKIKAAEDNISQLQSEMDDLNGQITQSKQMIAELGAQRKAVEEEIVADTALLEIMRSADSGAAPATDQIAELNLTLERRYGNAQAELLWYLNEYNRRRADVTDDVQSVEDVFTDYLIGEISDSDTVQAAVRSVIDGVTSGDSLDAVGRDAIASAMRELPGEVRSNVVNQFVDTTLIKNVNKVVNLLQGAPSRPQTLINQLSAQSDKYLVNIARFLESEQSLESFKSCVDDVELMYSLMQELQKAVPDAELQVDLWKECSWDMGAFYTGYANDLQMLEMMKAGAEGADIDE